MQILENYSIYELRIVARNIGVKSPTTKSRAVLIDEIKQIQNNQLKPFFTTKGRPAKKNLYIKNDIKEDNTNIFASISKKDIQLLINSLQKAQKYLNEIQYYLSLYL